MLNATSVSKSFGSVKAVEELNLSVAAGQLFCLLGANGAGKTTTINLFLGFHTPDSGRVLVGKTEPSVNPREARRQPLSSRRTWRSMPTSRVWKTSDSSASWEGSVAGVGLSGAFETLGAAGVDQIHRPVDGYSKGMRQKVGLAIAYAREARVLLLDEPLSGLDPAAASDFCEELARIREDGAAILMTTHDLFRAKELGGTIGIMRSGRLVETLQAADVGARDLERLYLHHMRRPEVIAE